MATFAGITDPTTFSGAPLGGTTPTQTQLIKQIIDAGKTVETSIIAGVDALWASTSGTVQLITTPTTVTILVTGDINLTSGGGTHSIVMSGSASDSNIGTFFGPGIAELKFVTGTGGAASSTGLLSIVGSDTINSVAKATVQLQGIQGVKIYTNGGASNPVILGIGPEPVIFDIVNAAPADGMLANGQGVFWRSGDSLRIKAKDNAGAVKSFTIGTLV